MNVNDLLRDYRAYLEHERRFARGTVEAYMSDLRDFARHVPGEVNTIAFIDMRVYLRCLSERGLHEHTIERKFAALRTFWRWLRRDGYATGDPLTDVLLPRPSFRMPIWLSSRELFLFAVTPSPTQRDALAWLLLAWLGLRRSELLNLRIEDVLIDAGVIIVRKPKNRHDRSLPIPGTLSEEFQAVIGGRRDGYVFVSSTGHRWPKTRFAAAFNDHIKACGLEGRGITPHVIRHSVATHMTERGVALPEVQQLLGHVDIKSTMLYVHVSAARLRAALDHHVLNEVMP